jgi:hypothetical protein
MMMLLTALFLIPAAAKADDAAIKKPLAGSWTGNKQTITLKEDGTMKSSTPGSECWDVRQGVFHIKAGENEDSFKIISLTETKFVFQDMHHGRHTGEWSRVADRLESHIDPVDPAKLQESLKARKPAAEHGDGVDLRSRWRNDMRYVWKDRVEDETRMWMGRAKSLMVVRRKTENQVEEVVRPGERAGEQRHEERWLSQLMWDPEQDGKIIFDTSLPRQGKHPMAEIMAEEWSAGQGAVTCSLRDAEGRISKMWVEGGQVDGGSGKPVEFEHGKTKFLTEELVSPYLIPRELKQAGDKWPLRIEVPVYQGANEVVAAGEYVLKSVEVKEGKRRALVGFTGTLSHSKADAAIRVGSGFMEKGSFEGSIEMDLESSTLVRSELRISGAVRIEESKSAPPSKRTEFSHRVERTLVSMEAAAIRK